MRRAGKILLWTLAALVALPILLLAVVLIVANTGPGQRWLETLTASLSGGMVHIEGLAGRFPDELQAARITVADADGVWLTVSDAVIDWSPSRLIEGEASVQALEAENVTVARMPRSSGSGGFNVPIGRVDLDRAHVARLDLAAPVSGRPLALTLEGNGTLESADTGEGHLAVSDLEPRGGPSPPSSYTLAVSIQPSRWHATLAINEGSNGLMSGLAQMPDLGGLTATASLDGPTGDLAAQARIEAGQLRGDVHGAIDLDNRKANLAFIVAAPAMHPRPDIGWSSVRVEGTVKGPFLAPDAKATLAADGLTAAGASIREIRATLAGVAGGQTELHASLSDVRLPGQALDLLANEPLALDATARLEDANQPVRFTLRHTLFSAEGTFEHLDRGHISLTVPHLAPIARAGGVDLRGQTKLDIDVAHTADAFDIAVKGGADVSEGLSPLPALVGANGTIDLAVSIRGEDVTLSRLALTGSAFSASATGGYKGGTVAADWNVSLKDLGAIRRGVSGTVTAQGHIGGTPGSLSIAADVTGDAEGGGGRVESVSAHVVAEGLPDAPSGRLAATGTLFDAPLTLAVAAERHGDDFHFVIDQAAWKSLNGSGTLDLVKGETLPVGKIGLSMSRLADLSPLLGRAIEGGVSASVDASAGETKLSATATRVSVPGVAALEKAELNATLSGRGNNPDVDGTLTLDGVEAKGIRADGRATAKGPTDAIIATVSATAGGSAAVPNSIQASGTLDAVGRSLSLASLRAAWGKEAVQLLAPARIGFAQDVTIDRLRLGFRQGELAVTGRLGRSGNAQNELSVTAGLTNLPANVLTIFEPAYAVDGTIAGEARLSGSTARPEGTIRLTAAGLRARSGPGRALPAATIAIAATLNGANARLDGRIAAGASNVTVSGLVPTNFTGPLDLSARGTADVAMIRPLLAARGMDARGRIDLAMTAGGTVSRPNMGGTLHLSNGDFQDVTMGTHLSAISADLRGDRDTVQIARLSARAGEGTIAASGIVRLGASPAVDISLRASNARLLASDLITARADANLSLRGPLAGSPVLGGTILVREADIQVPEKLPPDVAVLPVREAGKPPPKATASTMPDAGLNITLDAPARVYIRGRGVNAELGGSMGFTGTMSKPVPRGGLHLRRGQFSLAGTALDLTSGTIEFAGGGLTNPRLKLVATSTTATLTSTLTISGEVKDPKIDLSSTPPLPQDEILSQMLFHTAKTRLSPFQLAEIASALASMSGVNSPIGDPLQQLRAKLGLDQLSVGSNAAGGATLEAGRYVAPNVRIGASQAAGGTGTQATVQIDLAKGLKLETTAGSATSADVAAGSTNGASVGLKYQFEY